MKEVKKLTKGKNFYLTLFDLIKQGKNPNQITKVLPISKQALNYYLKTLKFSGFIKKVGYGTWEILKDFDAKEVKRLSKVANCQLIKVDMVRAHAFQFKIKIPKLSKWERREEILIQKGIWFKPILLGGNNRGQSIDFKNRKIWLLDKSIIIYEKYSYFAETAEEAKSYAIYELISLVNSLGKVLGADFNINRRIYFKVSRQHYSLVKNALAKQYNKEGKKLECYTEKGLWLSIDNSYNLNELETLHPETAAIDNEKVKTFFNGLKKLDGFTPEFVTNSIGQITENQKIFDRNMVSHLEVLNKIGLAVEELSKAVKELKK